MRYDCWFRNPEPRLDTLRVHQFGGEPAEEVPCIGFFAHVTALGGDMYVQLTYLEAGILYHWLKEQME